MQQLPQAANDPVTPTPATPWSRSATRAAPPSSTSTWPVATRRTGTAPCRSPAGELRGRPQPDRRLLQEPRPTRPTRASRSSSGCFMKEELRDVDGTDSLHPNRSGDVVVVFRPPYQIDAATPGSCSPSASSSASTGTCPTSSTSRTVNMHGDVRGRRARASASTAPVAGMSAIDLAPTLAYLLGIPGPQNASGQDPPTSSRREPGFKTIQILDISDYHGQLVPLTRPPTTSRRRRGQPGVRDRRLGVPEAVVRPVRARGRADDHGRRAATRSARRRRSARSSATRRRSSS